MSTRRYIQTLLPIAHINGKIAQSSDKCPNVDDPAKVDNDGFVYGYRRRDSGKKSLFAVRKKSRYLGNNPYTTDETANKQLFATSSKVVAENLKNATEREKAAAAFKKNPLNYNSLRIYCMARVLKNNGKWLENW